MKNNWLAAIVILSVVMISCGKGGSTGGGGSSDPCATEPALSVSTTPANGTTEAASLGPFSVTVTVNSTMPAAGVTISVKAHPDGSSTNYYTSSTTSTTKDNTFNITSTPSGGAVCVVDITVTSKSCASRTWSGSYKYSSK